MGAVRIYLDNCCYNRPLDDQTQTRVRSEAAAVVFIFLRCRQGIWTVAASETLEQEWAKLKDPEKLGRIQEFYRVADHANRLVVDAHAAARAAVFRRYGMKEFDSLHLALAETNRLDAFLTTDDRFLAAAARCRPAITVANPANWLKEVRKNERI